VYHYAGTNILVEDDDVIVVARKWLVHGRRNGPKHTMNDVEDESAALGLKTLVKHAKGISSLHLALAQDLDFPYGSLCPSHCPAQLLLYRGVSPRTVG